MRGFDAAALTWLLTAAGFAPSHWAAHALAAHESSGVAHGTKVLSKPGAVSKSLHPPQSARTMVRPLMYSHFS